MNTAQCPGRDPGQHQAGPAHSADTVNDRLTSRRTRPVVENHQYAAFARRILRAYARRIADDDIESLTDMTSLTARHRN